MPRKQNTKQVFLEKVIARNKRRSAPILPEHHDAILTKLAAEFDLPKDKVTMAVLTPFLYLASNCHQINANTEMLDLPKVKVPFLGTFIPRDTVMGHKILNSTKQKYEVKEEDDAGI